MGKFLSDCLSSLLSSVIFETKAGVIMVSSVLSFASLIGVGLSTLYEWIGLSAYILTFLWVFASFVAIIELGKFYILKTSAISRIVVSIKNGDLNIVEKHNVPDTLLRPPVKLTNGSSIWPLYVSFGKRLRYPKIQYDVIAGTKIKMVNSAPGDKVAFAEFVIESQDGQFIIDFNSK